MWEAAGALAAVFGVLAGIIKLLLDKYFKQAEILENMRKSNNETAIIELRDAIEEHKKELRAIKTELQFNTTAARQTNKDVEKMTNELSSYVSKTEARMQKFDSHIVEIGKDLHLLKGIKNAKRSQ